MKKVGIDETSIARGHDYVSLFVDLEERKVLFDHSGANWAQGAEKEIQNYLRLKDPGLPLAPAYSPVSLLSGSSSSAFS